MANGTIAASQLEMLTQSPQLKKNFSRRLCNGSSY